MSDLNNRAEIVAAAVEARRELSDLERVLQEEIDEIDFTAFVERRPLTPQEKQLRRVRRSDQGEVRDAFKELAFVTLQRLDQSAEVQQLVAKLTQVNERLGEDLDELKAIERYTAIAAKVADTLAKVVGKLAGLLI